MEFILNDPKILESLNQKFSKEVEELIKVINIVITEGDLLSTGIYSFRNKEEFYIDFKTTNHHTKELVKKLDVDEVQYKDVFISVGYNKDEDYCLGRCILSIELATKLFPNHKDLVKQKPLCTI